MSIKLIIKRLLAWMIDWVSILLYAGFLFLVVGSQIHNGLDRISPVTAQLIAFLTLTLPVVLYCILMEASSRHATLGKRIMKIKLVGNPNIGKVVFRNILKFLPWEIAHVGVFWTYSLGESETPAHVWVLLIVPQILIVIYLGTLIASLGRKTLYDSIANTEIGEV